MALKSETQERQGKTVGGEIWGFLYNKFWPRARTFEGFAVIFRLAMFLVCFNFTHVDFQEIQEEISQRIGCAWYDLW